MGWEDSALLGGRRQGAPAVPRVEDQVAVVDEAEERLVVDGGHEHGDDDLLRGTSRRIIGILKTESRVRFELEYKIHFPVRSCSFHILNGGEKGL